MTRRKWMDQNKPGRLDVDGIEWYATDPYPTWFRRDKTGEIIEPYDEPEWADKPGASTMRPSDAMPFCILREGAVTDHPPRSVPSGSLENG